MDVQEAKRMFEYHWWANRKIMAQVLTLNAAQFTREFDSSFRSIRDTLVHAMSADWMWLERWKGVSPRAALRSANFSTAADVESRWTAIQQDQERFMQRLAEADLPRLVTYTNIRGDVCRYPLWQLVWHVVNHGTYHRGQVTTLLRQAGSRSVGTDIPIFFEEKYPVLPG